MTRHRYSLSALTGVLLLAGCATRQRSSDVDVINRKYLDERRNHYTAYPVDPADDPLAAINTPGRRNDLIEDLLRMIDNHYENYVSQLRRQKAFSDFGLDVVGLALGTAGTLTGSAGSKTTLSALVTALSASRSSFDKNVLLEQTIPVLIAKMDAQRATKKTAIRQSMKDDSQDDQPLGKYSVRTALTDLTEYYSAGTVTRALTAVAEDAAVEKRKAELAANRLRGITGNAKDLP